VKKAESRRDVIVIGAGAAGLMCAISAGRRGRAVAVLEHTAGIGNKIRVSGGGRCNFTNTNLDYENYLSGNPHFCRSALSRFTPRDFIGMITAHGISYYEKEDGQIFCKEGSAAITRMLLKECDDAGVEIRLNCKIRDVIKDDGFVVHTSYGVFEAPSLVVATGGLSYAGLGASGMGYRVAGRFGLRVTALRPALVPFTFYQKDTAFFHGLRGVSMLVLACAGRKKFRGNILFTHRGLSGPAVLQISSYWKEGEPVVLDLLPDTDIYELLASRRGSRMEMSNFLSRYLPKRFAHRWCDAYLTSKPLCRFDERELKDAVYRLHNWEIFPLGTEGYKKAEVTLGGVDTVELSSRTMESRKVPGLYFAGEVVDVTGQLGGYNLQWAWSSGYVAGQYA
jgi:predicted Rossmann fold flavoprotein